MNSGRTISLSHLLLP